MADNNRNGPFNVMGDMSGREDQNNTAKATNEFQAAWEDAQTESLRHLRNIDKNVAEMLKKGIPMSQSAARDAAGRGRDSDDNTDSKYSRRYRDRSHSEKLRRHDGQEGKEDDYSEWRSTGKHRGRTSGAKWEKTLEQVNNTLNDTAATFYDTLEDSILEGAIGFDFKGSIQESLGIFADKLGVSIEDVGPELGRVAAKQMASAFAQTDLGKRLKEKVSPIFQNFANRFRDRAMGTAYGNMPEDPTERVAELERMAHNYSQRVVQDKQTEIDLQHQNSGPGGRPDTISQTSAKDTEYYKGNVSSIQSLDVAAISNAVFHLGTVQLAADTVQLLAHNVQMIGQSDVNYDPNIVDVDNYTEYSSGTSQPQLPSSGDSELLALPPAESSQGEVLALPSGQDIDLGGDISGDALGQVADVDQLGGTASTALSLIGAASDGLSDMSKADPNTSQGQAQMVDAGGEIAKDVGTEVITDVGSQAISAVATGAGMPIPPELIAVLLKPVVEALLGPFLDALGQAITKLFMPMIEKWGDLKEDIGDAFNRSTKSAEKNRELAQKRYKADVESLIEAPFEILKDAAQKMYDVWDKSLRQINGTQGYDKAGLQDLMSDYADRLRSEGLASVIGTNDVTENLSKVLDSGMSGQIAEEFAYIATKLNAAIPTQDFFSYGETYVSLASQAMQAGKSQSEAIAYANSQLESFASGVLYANRTLTGGFTTGLQDAATLFKQATQIAQTGKSSNASQIASVLTAVSGIVGGVAPDLADGIIDAIYNAAVGGNDSSIVALRSMAGINASNTEFLRQLVTDPQKIFTDMFKGFANLQNMSNDNYMEVAEALSDTFGVPMEAIARVDFNYLARAIENMDTGTSALNENIAHLASGETTTTAEAMRLAKVNEYMIEEGLSYVLDNEVARSIQEHMWDEQIARELMEATYAVELQGSALSFLQSIYNIVDVISTILNPFRLLSKLGDLVITAAEGQALKADIAQTLLLGQVGKGNASAYHDLITTNADLNLTPSYIHLQGGVSAFAQMEGMRQFKDILNPLGSFGNGIGATQALHNQVTQSLLGITDMAANAVFSSRDSAYSWGKLSKSTATALAKANLASGAGVSSGSSIATSLSSSTAAQDQANAKLAKLVEGEFIKDNYVAQGKTYEDWVKDTKSKGFADVAAALEAAGLSEDDVKGQFSAAEGQMGSEEAAKIEAEEKQMRQIVIINTPLIVEHLKKQEEFQTWQREEAWEAMTVWGQNIQKTLGDPDELSIQSLLGSTGDKESIIGLLGGEGGILPTLAGKDGILEHITNIDDALNNDSSGMKKLLTEMTDYVVRHNVYNQSLNGSTSNTSTSWYDDIRKVQLAEKDEASSAIYALVEALTSNMVDLKDPQVAGNALLAQILKVLQVIQTQQAGAGGSTSLADSLIGLALGYTPTST